VLQGSFTVKREASVFGGFFDCDAMTRVQDGIFGDKTEVPCDFDIKPYEDGKKIRTKGIDHIYSNGCLICEVRDVKSSESINV
jgi:hypothetical protein